jgi:hypothetical protein
VELAVLGQDAAPAQVNALLDDTRHSSEGIIAFAPLFSISLTVTPLARGLHISSTLCTHKFHAMFQ